jgi:hypothetical protein
VAQGQSDFGKYTEEWRHYGGSKSRRLESTGPMWCFANWGLGKQQSTAVQEIPSSRNLWGTKKFK